MTNSGGLDATYHYYLDGQSLVETRNGSDQVLKQHVWGLDYIDELIQVGLNIDPQNADTGLAAENICERFFWPLHNANFNVMALVNAGGVMIERYEYTPYGGRTVFSHGWMLADFNNDGVVGQGDVDLVLAHWGGTSDADQVAEAGDNGLVGQYELALVLNNYGSALPNDPQVHHPTAGSFRGDPDAGLYGVALNDIGHQGLMHDEEIGKIYNRARILDPRLGRFMQRDPLGYVDGMSQYEYVRSRPTTILDPTGTLAIQCCREELSSAKNNRTAKHLLSIVKDLYRPQRINRRNPGQRRFSGSNRPSFRKLPCLTSIRCVDDEDQSYRGAYYPDTGKIVINAPRVNDYNDVLQTLIHELAHAIGSCRKAPKSCSECMQEEIRAYFVAGSCNRNAPTACIFRAAASCRIICESENLPVNHWLDPKYKRSPFWPPDTSIFKPRRL